MKFSETMEQASDLLQRKGRLSYRTLKLEFDLSDEQLEALKEELIEVQELAVDKDGKMLVWVGGEGNGESAKGGNGEGEVVSSRFSVASPQALTPNSQSLGERRQLTVLFCDMVGFTELANRVDPEVLQGIIRSYEDACAVCITRYEGYVYQRLGDGIVAFFGYPLAHEGEAERAIHVGLAIIESLFTLTVPEVGQLHVRIGIATGVVVVAGAEKGAVGETMNLASRLQGIASVDSIVVSERVRRLAGGVFDYVDLGEQSLKGIAQPTRVYRIAGVSHAASRFEAATQTGLTPLVGREHEIALLLERWQLAQDGEGQVVLLSGEPGIGKSRILSALRERIEVQGAQALRFQCSPYYGTTRTVTIPATLRDSLMARLDRFLPVKEIAQIGAAIGREFSYELLAAVAPIPKTDLDRALNQLTESGLAFRRGAPPEATYTFKHALAQDVAEG